MGKMKDMVTDPGDDVMSAIGDLHATAKDAAKAVAETQIDHEEVKGWLTTIFKAIISALK
jgi:hypothetical protein